MRFFGSCSRKIASQSASATRTPSRIASGFSPASARTSPGNDSTRNQDDERRGSEHEPRRHRHARQAARSHRRGTKWGSACFCPTGTREPPAARYQIGRRLRRRSLSFPAISPVPWLSSASDQSGRRVLVIGQCGTESHPAPDQCPNGSSPARHACAKPKLFNCGEFFAAHED
jgi:hypothetical protein